MVQQSKGNGVIPRAAGSWPLLSEEWMQDAHASTMAPAASGEWPLNPLRWAVLPVAYLAYAIARAQMDGLYPYPFLNVARHGWLQVGLTSGMIAVAFMIVGVVIVWIDRRLG